MKTFSRFIIDFVILMILVGCSTANSTSNPTAVATGSSELIPEFAAIEHSPTYTPRPSSIPLPRATLNLTQTAIFQIITSTQEAEQTLAAQFPRVCKDTYAPLKRSPNGLWMEELCFSRDDQDLALTLSNRETKVLWKLLYRDYIPQIDFADGGMSVVHWSNDGIYAYFFSFLGGDGGECFYRGDDRGSGLFRLDLLSGQIKAILPLNNDFWWYGFSFSTTDRRLVYGARARDLKFLDITTGETINIASKDTIDETGGFLWSSDGMKLVYSALTRDEQGQRESYSLRLADAVSGTERILLESTEDCFAARAWTEDNIITIERYDKNYNRTLIEYDLNSNRVSYP